jgi:uncharacterized damage-inducible protein DinB
MSRTENLIAAMQFNRTRTLGLLDSVEKEASPEGALGYRPGAGRAHIAWQLMHIGITEDLFASERLSPGKKGLFETLWPRFRGGSTPDDEIPSLAVIRETLAKSREHLLRTLAEYNDSRLGEIPEALKARALTFLDVMHILCWHEGHHQGQAHITLNLYKARPK